MSEGRLPEGHAVVSSAANTQVSSSSCDRPAERSRAREESPSIELIEREHVEDDHMTGGPCGHASGKACDQIESNQERNEVANHSSQQLPMPYREGCRMSSRTSNSLVGCGSAMILFVAPAWSQTPPPVGSPRQAATQGVSKAVVDAQGWIAWNIRFQGFRPDLQEPGYLSMVMRKSPECFPAVLMFSSMGSCKFKRRYDELTRPATGPLCGPDTFGDSPSDTRMTRDIVDFSRLTTVDTASAPEGEHVVVIHLSGYKVSETVTTVAPDGTETVEHRSLPDTIKVPSAQLPQYLDAIEKIRTACAVEGQGGGTGSERAPGQQ